MNNLILACDLKGFISRCSVCEVQANTITIHSQTDQVSVQAIYRIKFIIYAIIIYLILKMNF